MPTSADVARQHFAAFGADAARRGGGVSGSGDRVAGGRGRRGRRRGDPRAPMPCAATTRIGSTRSPSCAPTVEEILREDGDRVAAVVRHSGRGRASGVPVEGRYFVACIVEDGRIVAGREYSTRDEAREAEVPRPG